MKADNRIRVTTYCFGYASGFEDYTVEEFRYCLGIFQTPQHREAEHFTPLCELYERGPDSKSAYISNYGEHITDMVQGWSDLPS